MRYMKRCKCCLETGSLRSMWDNHNRNGIPEVYGEMIIKCFALDWQRPTHEEQICGLCVGRLRNALLFKNQVLETEQLLLEELNDNQGEDDDPLKSVNLDIDEVIEFLETEYLEEPAQGNTNNLQNNSILKGENSLNVRANTKVDEIISQALGKGGSTDCIGSLITDTTFKEINIVPNSTIVEEDIKSTQTGNLLIGDTTIRKIKCEHKSTDTEESIKSVNMTNDNIYDTDETISVIADNELEETDIVDHTMKPVPQPLYNIPQRVKHQDNLRTILLCTNATPIRKRSDAGYLCAFCDTGFRDAEKLKEHTIYKHDNITKAKYMKKTKMYEYSAKLDITSLQCNLCGASIHTLEEVLEHLKNKHNETVHMDIKSHLIPLKFHGDELKCFMCQEEFSHFKLLIQHMNIHYNNFECKSCNLYFVTQNALKSHYRTHASGEFPCGYCPKVFDAKCKKTNHERKIHRLGNYIISCGLCKAKFKDVGTKETHLDEIHGVIRKPSYKCYACEKVFYRKKSLKQHIDSYHLSIKNFTCPLCGKEYFDKRTFTEHMGSHNRVKDYVCDVCHKSFSIRRTLVAHMRTHFSDYKYKCETCEKTFFQKVILQKHVKKVHSLKLIC